jgi:hypothetical protein
MSNSLIPFGGNCATSVVKQAKYRVTHHNDGFAIEVVIETPDDIRSYPTSHEHPKLVEMVNKVKMDASGREGGPFYINEWQQVIVPAGDSAKYYYAGEYHSPIILKLDDEEFSGRPHDDTGNLLKPGDPWTGRPRPGIGYVLKAGGADIQYTIELGPGREKVVRLSKVEGPDAARLTARKIAQIKGNKGGSFYVNEYRALFGAQLREDGYSYVFIGMLTNKDAWFTKWEPAESAAQSSSTELGDQAPSEAVDESSRPAEFEPSEKKLEINDGDIGHSMESLFGAYMQGAKSVTLEDPFMIRPHQVANFLRFSELLVRIGSIQEIKLVTKEISDDARGRLETIKRSLDGYNVAFEYSALSTLHDRQITTDTGWEISLGRGLDIYKCPEDWLAVGATDFALRPCFQTNLIFHRLGQAAATEQSA